MDNAKKATFKIPRDELYSYWLQLTQPIHGLGKGEMKVLSELLLLRESYSTKITDDELLDEYTFSTKNRKLIIKKIGMNSDRFANILSSLRKSNVIKDNKFNPSYLPNITTGATKYDIIFELKFTNESRQDTTESTESSGD